ncbi:MAG: sugar ABC transporter permease, partial [Clostridia bacterium]
SLTPKKWTLEQKNAATGYVMVSPIIIGILIFSVLPVLFSLYISFTNWDMLHDQVWIGLDNYVKIFSGSMLGTVTKNTLVYCVIAIPGSIVLGLLLALAMNAKIKGIALYRTAFFMPNITTTVAVCIVWSWLYNKDFGLFNNILTMLGLAPIKWISSQAWAMPSVAIMSIWQAMGYDMILLTAGLKGIDETYYEAAQIDGANSWQSFRRITFPMLTPTLFFLVVTHCINYVQMFDAAFIMTDGGPGYATRTIVMQIYNTAFEYFRMGEAASYAWVLFVIVFVITVLQFKLQDKWVNYDV